MPNKFMYSEMPYRVRVLSDCLTLKMKANPSPEQSVLVYRLKVIHPRCVHNITRSVTQSKHKFYFPQ